MEANNQVLLRYAPNPNGSINDIAGIRNQAGNVYGMMPHPERAVESHHPCLDGLPVLRAFLQPLLQCIPRPTCPPESWKPQPRPLPPNPDPCLNVEITPELVAQHGLLPEEYERILGILGRTPNLTELGIFSVMWSEHCAYKNTRKLLKLFPTEKKDKDAIGQVLVKAGDENAGVIDVGEGWGVAFKIESHNHPSAIEPFEGAATGVGGIVRDIFTMGARPVLLTNSLRFGIIRIQPGKAFVQGSGKWNFPLWKLLWVFPIWAEMFILMIVTRETPWSMPCVPGFYGMKKFKRVRPPGWVILFIM